MYCVVCRSPYKPGDTFCQICGAKIAPSSAIAAAAVAPAPILVPATPYQADGLLVVPRTATLPPICIKCGRPATFLPYRYTWFHPAFYLLCLIGLLPAAIVILIVQKKLDVATPLCPDHLRERKTRIRTGTALLLLCVPVGVAVGILPKDPDSGLYGFLLGFLMFIVGYVLISMRVPMRAKHIDDYRGKFRVSPEFLMQIPRQ